jgi:hypothetical protein
MTAPLQMHETARPWVLPALRALGAILTLLIVVQSGLAGQALFAGGSIDVHGYIGNASFTLGLVIAGVAIFGRAPRALVVIAVLLLAGLFSQIGLGYSGRESLDAAAWHVPLGVSCLGLAAVLTTVAFLTQPPVPGSAPA